MLGAGLSAPAYAAPGGTAGACIQPGVPRALDVGGSGPMITLTARA
jgi:hypothetical protein